MKMHNRHKPNLHIIMHADEFIINTSNIALGIINHCKLDKILLSYAINFFNLYITLINLLLPQDI